MQLTHGRSDLCCSSGHEVVRSYVHIYIYNYIYIYIYIYIYVHIHAFQTDHAYEFIEVATI